MLFLMDARPWFLRNWYILLTSKISSNTGEISSKTYTWPISNNRLNVSFGNNVPCNMKKRSFIRKRNFVFISFLAPNQNLYFSIKKICLQKNNEKKTWKKYLFRIFFHILRTGLRRWNIRRLNGLTNFILFNFFFTFFFIAAYDQNNVF